MSKHLCEECMDLKSSAEFQKASSNEWGLDYKCKTCRQRYNRDRYAIRKDRGKGYTNCNVKGVGRVSKDMIRVLRILAIKERFRDWCEKGGAFT